MDSAPDCIGALVVVQCARVPAFVDSGELKVERQRRHEWTDDIDAAINTSWANSLV